VESSTANKKQTFGISQITKKTYFDSITTLIVMTLRITTLSITVLVTVMLNFIMLKCHYAEVSYLTT
jgi:hypothetical protein